MSEARRETSLRPPQGPYLEGQRRLSHRAEAWLYTGPVGRVVAFFGDLGAGIGGWALRRAGLRGDVR